MTSKLVIRASMHGDQALKIVLKSMSMWIRVTADIFYLNFQSFTEICFKGS